MFGNISNAVKRMFGGGKRMTKDVKETPAREQSAVVKAPVKMRLHRGTSGTPGAFGRFTNPLRRFPSQFKEVGRRCGGALWE